MPAFLKWEVSPVWKQRFGVSFYIPPPNPFVLSMQSGVLAHFLKKENLLTHQSPSPPTPEAREAWTSACPACSETLGGHAKYDDRVMPFVNLQLQDLWAMVLPSPAFWPRGMRRRVWCWGPVCSPRRESFNPVTAWSQLLSGKSRYEVICN